MACGWPRRATRRWTKAPAGTLHDDPIGLVAALQSSRQVLAWTVLLGAVGASAYSSVSSAVARKGSVRGRETTVACVEAAASSSANGGLHPPFTRLQAGGHACACAAAARSWTSDTRGVRP